MTVSRTVAAALIAGSLTAACTSSGGGNTTSGAPSGTAASTGTTATCTVAAAKTARQTLISKSGFSPSCVKIKAKAKFFFVNSERKHHSATTRKGSPVSFDADLPNKNSTYAQVFRKKGTYVITDKTTKKTMTLFVT